VERRRRKRRRRRGTKGGEKMKVYVQSINVRRETEKAQVHPFRNRKDLTWYSYTYMEHLHSSLQSIPPIHEPSFH
jgi:hypothetical protein